jgi:hypothetical protein
MSDPTASDTRGETVETEKPRLADEMAKMEKEPLLPMEKKLIAYSLALGVVLLVLLAWVATFFRTR